MIKLKNTFVLITQENNMPEERKIGSIIIPDTVNSVSKQRWGQVMAVGNGTPEEPMELKVGDRVTYLHDEGRIEIDGMLLMRQEDILLVDDEE